MLGLHRNHTAPASASPVVRLRYSYSKASLGGYRITEMDRGVVEVVSCESVAASHTAHLNAGESVLDRHALIGCRVVPMQEGQG